MITVRLPAALRSGAEDVIDVHEPVATIADLIEVLDRRLPGIAAQLDDSIFNFAVNDDMLLHRALSRTLADGDVVEVVPAISGG